MYEIRQIHPEDAKENERMRALLAKEGLAKDANLEYSVGLFDQEDRLVATGSSFGDSLRCLAVDSEHQGEGLMAQVVTHLRERLFYQGIAHVFLYTKPEAAPLLSQLGFYPILAVSGQLVFMENRRDGFARYLDGLGQGVPGERVGAIVMNANPFTLGHQALVERAVQSCDRLHLFVVSEDRSFFPFSVRKRLILAGTSHLDGIQIHETGSYLISSAVFPSYFLKEEDAVTRAQARLDAGLFIKIASRLLIKERFVGEEPFSHATRLYNEEMDDALPKAGIRLRILERKKGPDGIPISATRVRNAFALGDEKLLSTLVPPTTLAYLRSEEGKALVAERISAGFCPRSS